jgi:hypothetical protein
VNLQLAHFSPAQSAQAWQLTSANAITRLADVTIAASTLSVTLPAQSITLFVVPAVSATRTITAVAGTPQAAPEGGALGMPLQAAVRDPSGNGVAGVVVTFTAPTAGPSATFNGSASATATTNSAGVATAPAAIANTRNGNYVITATGAGASGAAQFAITNTVVSPWSGTAAAGTPQSAQVNRTFAVALQAAVKDVYGNPVGGLAVTFTTPASGASASFSGGSHAVTVTTDAGGAAVAPSLTANGTAGTYMVTASASGLATPVPFSLSNTNRGKHGK